MFKNREKFDAVLPEVMDCLMSSSKFTQYNLPEVGNWVKKLVNTMHGGKQGRALAVPFVYQTMEDPKYFTEEKLHSARFLGWSLEMLHGFIITVDDIIDASTTRRGKPCWHLLPNVGTSEVNDCVPLFHCVMEQLDIKFGTEPFYTDLVKLINESVLWTTIGQYLDLSFAYNKENNNLDGFTMERFDAFAIQKAGWYSFRLLMLAGLLFVKDGKKRGITELIDISLEFGKILQFQNDYKDIYWKEDASGKVGTDIQEGKLSWIAVAAVERCNEAQRAIFKEYYGSKDPEHVQRIKQLYDEIKIENVYDNFRNSVYENFVRRIRALPNKGETEFCLEVLEACRRQIY